MVGEFARTPRYQGAGSSQVNPTRVDVAARRAARRRCRTASRSPSPPGFGIDDDRRRDAALRRRGRARSRRGADVVVRVPRPARAPTSPRASTARTSTCPPPSSTCSRRLAREPAHRSSSCSPTARRCAPRPGRSTRAGASWSAGCSARPAAARSPTCSRRRRTRRGRLAETIPLRLRGHPVVPELPRRGRATCATARACSSATAATTPLDQQVALPVRPRPVLHDLRATTTSTVGVAGSHAAGDLAVEVTCTVTNTGDRAGPGGRAALRRRPEAVGRPAAARAEGLRQARPGAGESGDARRSRCTARDLSYWSETERDWVLEGGEFELARRRVVARPALASAPSRRRAAGRGRRSGRCPRWRSGSPTPGAARLLAEAVGTDERRPARRHPRRRRAARVIGNFPLAGAGRLRQRHAIDRPPCSTRWSRGLLRPVGERVGPPAEADRRLRVGRLASQQVQCG